MNTPTILSYLYFNGRCDEALEFYKSALGAEILTVMRHKDNPEPPAACECEQMPADKVMHGAFKVGETIVMASDGRCVGETNFEGFSLALTVSTEAEADRYFNGLTNGGKVIMPQMKTFFSPRFGMVTDKFGVTWIVLVASHGG